MSQNGLSFIENIAENISVFCSRHTVYQWVAGHHCPFIVIVIINIVLNTCLSVTLLYIYFRLVLSCTPVYCVVSPLCMAVLFLFFPSCNTTNQELTASHYTAWWRSSCV